MSFSERKVCCEGRMGGAKKIYVFFECCCYSVSVQPGCRKGFNLKIAFNYWDLSGKKGSGKFQHVGGPRVRLLEFEIWGRCQFSVLGSLVALIYVLCLRHQLTRPLEIIVPCISQDSSSST